MKQHRVFVYANILLACGALLAGTQPFFAQSISEDHQIVAQDSEAYVTASPNPQSTVGEGSCTYLYSHSTYQWIGDVKDTSSCSNKAYLDTSRVSDEMDDHEADVIITDHYCNTCQTLVEPEAE